MKLRRISVVTGIEPTMFCLLDQRRSRSDNQGPLCLGIIIAGDIGPREQRPQLRVLMLIHLFAPREVCVGMPAINRDTLHHLLLETSGMCLEIIPN